MHSTQSHSAKYITQPSERASVHVRVNCKGFTKKNISKAPVLLLLLYKLQGSSESGAEGPGTSTLGSESLEADAESPRTSVLLSQSSNPDGESPGTSMIVSGSSGFAWYCGWPM